MKHTIQLFLLLFLMSSAGKAQHIISLSIVPANPTEMDTIFLVTVTNYQAHPNYLEQFSFNTDGSTINATALHSIGEWDFGYPKTHIMQIGSLNTGNYELNYQSLRYAINDTLTDTLSFSVLGSPVEVNDSIITEQNIALSLSEGWNMIGYTCQESLNVIEAFSTVEDKIIIVKDNLGNSYLPDWEFNGIGDLEFAKGYQLKITEDISDFYFCPTLIYSE
jgi:hypothetical protein